MSKEIKIDLMPALSGFPIVMAFNRYVVTHAKPYIVATCGLVSDDGELLSSFSFSINKEMDPENTGSIVKYLSRSKPYPAKPDYIHRGIRMPQGGVTIAHAALVNAGRNDNFAEIRLENYAPSALRFYPTADGEPNAQKVKCEGVALLRSSFECHFNLLADIYMKG